MVMIMTVHDGGINSPVNDVTIKSLAEDETTGLKETTEAGVIEAGHRAMPMVVIIEETGTHLIP